MAPYKTRIIYEYEKTNNQAKNKFLLIHDGRFAYCCLFYARFSGAFAFGFIIMSLQQALCAKAEKSRMRGGKPC